MGEINPPGALQDPVGYGQGPRFAAGQFLLEVGLEDGVRIERVKTTSEAVLPQPRLTPALVLPAGPIRLLDREHEIGQALTALRSETRRFEIYGTPGSGKTALLLALAHHPLASGFRDGVIYLDSGSKPLEDLFAIIAQKLFDGPPGTCLTPFQNRDILRDRQALILLDDLDLQTDEVAEMQQAVPGCTFLLASTQRHFPLEGQSLALNGLPPEAALALFERGLERPLDTGEIPAARLLCSALRNHPLSVFQAGALVRRSGDTLSQAVTSIAEAAGPSQALAGRLLESLSNEEQLLIYALAALGGAFEAPDHLAALARIQEPLPALERLAGDGLVEVYQGRFRLAGSLADVVLNNWDLSDWKVACLHYLADWAGQQPVDAPALLAETGMALHLMNWAAGTRRWTEAMRLSRPLQDSLALAGHWGGWSQAAELSLQAAQQLGARAAEAWALHQAGVLAMCLGDERRARASLVRALQIRQTLGDTRGASLTQDNLNVLFGGEGARRQPVNGMNLAPAGPATTPAPVPAVSPPVAGDPTALAAGDPTVLAAGDPTALAAGDPTALAAGATWLPAAASRRPVQLLALAGILLILVILAILAGWLIFRRQPSPPATTGQPPVILPGQLPQATLPPTRQLFFPLVFDNFVVEPTVQGIAIAALSPTQSPGLQFSPFTISPPTPGPTPTSSSTPTITPTLAGATLIADTCQHPIGWMVYTVKSSDTLPLIAASVGLTPQALLQANCLKDLNWLTAGEQVWVPRLPGSEIPGAQAQQTAAPTDLVRPAPSEQPPVLVSTLVPAPPPTACLEFEDLGIYSTYAAGDGFKTGGFPLTVNGFVARDERFIRNGWIEVGAGRYAGGDGQELELDRASLGFRLSQPVAGLTFLFNDYTGGLNLEVNGAFLRFANFSELQGITLGGAIFNVKGGQGDGQGSLEILGVLRTVQIGGEQLWLDRVCFK